MAHVVAQESAAMGANQTRVEEGFTEDPYLSEELLVLSSGKPIIEPWIANSTSALVQQFYPSEEGGNALADILFRDYNPSGRLSVNFPVKVTNTSPVDGTDVVQLFIVDSIASIDVPNRKLKRFKKIRVKTG
ncbi:hypothetical protein PCG10_000897 [Penicillium crustosum]|uniref:beta-glucosidase n=1 Tax=Penicillium crustosum TaxID=36656 RepID=A0A9P5GSY9_PENCR|nr:hypothetical protein PCG10_000897 [Penicillium crustosum]